MNKFLKAAFLILLFAALAFFSIVVAVAFNYPWWYGIFFFVFFILLYQVGKYAFRLIKQSKFIKLDIQISERKKLLSRLKSQFISMLKYTRLAKKSEQKVLPWVLVMGANNAGKTGAIFRARVHAPVNAVDPTAPLESDLGFNQWLLEDAVCIEAPGGLLDLDPNAAEKSNIEKEWQQLISLLVKHYQDVRLKGIAVAISVDMLRSDADSITKHAAEIRRRIDELSAQTGVIYPVYIVVTKSDKLYGFKEFATALPYELRNQAMGIIDRGDLEHEKVTGKVNHMISIITDRFETLSLMMLHSVGTMQSPILMLCQEIQDLAEDLSLFASTVFKEYYYFERPLFRGLFFTSAEHQHQTEKSLTLPVLNDLVIVSNNRHISTEGLFLQDLFKSVLPADQAPLLTLQFVQKKRRTRVMAAYAAWWFACLFSAIYLGVAYSHALKQLNLIEDNAKKRDNQFGDNLHKNVLLSYSDYQDVATVQDIENQWQFSVWPFSGTMNQIFSIYKEHYVTNFKKYVVGTLDDELAKDLAYHDKFNPSPNISYYIQNMISRVNLIQARVDGQSDNYIKNLQSPMIDHIGFTTTNVQAKEPFGDLYKSYILWENDLSILKNEGGSLRNLIESMELYKTSFKWLIDWANSQQGLEPITLATFWPNILSMPEEVRQISVPAAYTQAGATAIYNFIQNLQSVQPNPAEYEKYEFAFRVWYTLQREAAWRHYLSSFALGLSALQDEQDWFSALRVPLYESPYWAVLDRLQNEFDDTKLLKTPEWLKVVFEINRYRGVASLQAEGDRFGKAGYITRIGTVAKQFTRKIGVGSDKDDMLPNVIEYYTEYLKQLDQISSKVVNMSNPDAFDVAKRFYTNQEFEESSPFYQAFGSYQMVRYYLSKHYSFHDPANDIWGLLRGPLDFYLSSVVMRAACHIQSEWKDKILGHPASATSITNRRNVLFGKEGEVSDFIKNNILPFVTYTSYGYEPKEVFGHKMEFTKAFFEVLNIQQQLAFQEQRRQDMNSKVTNDQYLIMITSYPADVNKNAKIQPVGTSLSTRCDTTKYQLNGYNFKSSSALPWKMQGCGEATLTISFGGFEIVKQYATADGFLQFLAEFKDGEKVFTKTDFPDYTDVLNSYNIEEVVVRYDIKGLSNLYPQIEDYLHIKSIIEKNVVNSDQELELPGIITECWGSTAHRKN